MAQLSEKSAQYEKRESDIEAGPQDALKGEVAPPVFSAATAAKTSDDSKKLNPAVVIAIWISLSSSVILYNKYILSELRFQYPIFLVTWHLLFATVGTRVLARTTRLLDGLANVQMTWERWLKSIVPVGALFSASLIFSNMAYLTLSVSFIQMLKAFTSVAVLIMSVVMGTQQPDRRTFIIVLCISGGVALASYGEVGFAWSGFICQALGIFFEASRLVAIEKLLHGMKMDPLVSLYYFAPVCAGLNAVLVPIYEGMDPLFDAWDQLGPFVLITNAACAFLLNISVVFLIGCASSLVLTLSGVVKDILLVVGSVVLLSSTVTFVQIIGYGIALAGLVVFKTKKEILDQYILKVRGWLR